MFTKAGNEIFLKKKDDYYNLSGVAHFASRNMKTSNSLESSGEILQ